MYSMIQKVINGKIMHCNDNVLSQIKKPVSKIWIICSLLFLRQRKRGSNKINIIFNYFFKFAYWDFIFAYTLVFKYILSNEIIRIV